MKKVFKFPGYMAGESIPLPADCRALLDLVSEYRAEISDSDLTDAEKKTRLLKMGKTISWRTTWEVSVPTAVLTVTLPKKAFIPVGTITVNPDKPVGPQLREYRVKSGMAATEMATRLGVERQKVWQVESATGEYAVYSKLSFFVNYARALGAKSLTFEL